MNPLQRIKHARLCRQLLREMFGDQPGPRLASIIDKAADYRMAQWKDWHAYAENLIEQREIWLMQVQIRSRFRTWRYPSPVMYVKRTSNEVLFGIYIDTTYEQVVDEVKVSPDGFSFHAFDDYREWVAWVLDMPAIRCREGRLDVPPAEEGWSESEVLDV